MRKYLIFLIFFIAIHLKGFSQKNNSSDLRFQKLLDAVNVSGKFIYSKPVNQLIFVSEIDEVLYAVRDPQSPEKIDTSIIMDIMRNNTVIDTTHWTDKEIKNYSLVKEPGKVRLQYVINKLHLKKKNEIQFYKTQVDSLKSPEACNVKVYSISKPLFDSKKEYAILEYDLYGCQDSFYKYGVIFKYEKNNWRELGAYYGLKRGRNYDLPLNTKSH